jgi:xanthine dehydrogenase accessory factor
LRRRRGEAGVGVGADGRVTGSVSGGCVEGAVHELCERVLAGPGAEHARFGIDDESAFAVGLSCGGEIDVFVQAADAAGFAAEPFERALAGASSGLATLVAGPRELVGRVVVPGASGTAAVGTQSPGTVIPNTGTRGTRTPGTAATRAAGALDDADLAAAGVHGISAARIETVLDRRIRSGRSGLVRLECDGDDLVFFCESRLALPRMLIFGAVAFAQALAAASALLGYRVTVCDPRPLFATPERFPAAHEVVAAWPSDVLAGIDVDERTVVCVLGHDARSDIPVLAAALDLPVAYVGALGSRRTHEERIRMLRQAGVGDTALARLHSPIGLDLGAATPEETAVSILAEVIASRSGRDARPLGETSGPIHAGADRVASGAETPGMFTGETFPS